VRLACRRRWRKCRVPPGAAVAGRVPTLLRVVKVGGRVMIVVGVVAARYELYKAKPEEQPRVAVGLAGGFLLGAGAGLVCGPGAPVCSIIAGLVLGTIGALGGRAVAETMYDELRNPTPYTGYPGHSRSARSATTTRRSDRPAHDSSRPSRPLLATFSLAGSAG
jgi:hypothetical protein